MTGRVQGQIEGSGSFSLAGHVRPAILRAQDKGPVAPWREMPRMSIRFARTTFENADLLRLLEVQQTSESAEYHRWLTAAEFADRFGLSTEDIQRVAAWLRRAGFQEIEIPPSRTSVSFSGTAGQVEAAFHTSIHEYIVDGQLHIANATGPVLPQALQGVVESISGLHDFHPEPHAAGLRRMAVKSHFTTNDDEHVIAPDDFATIYDVKALYELGIDGGGQKIAIAGQSDIAVTDIQAFRTAAGLSRNNPQVVLVGRDPGAKSADQREADLDLEWAGAVAKNATVIYVNSEDVFESASYAIEHDLAGVLSISYGACEAELTAAESASLTSVFEQANAEGITVMAASGDAGGAGCDQAAATATHGLVVDVPASMPYVTGVGGTAFADDDWTYWNPNNNQWGGSALSYMPETAWNDTAAVGMLFASGGGKSKLFSKPAWQTGQGVPNDGARDVPDVSFAASPEYDGYLICTGGNCVNGFLAADSSVEVIGGTSCTSPSMAGIVALLDQMKGGAQGNINPGLYQLAAASNNAFHDIWNGDNYVPCTAGSPDCVSMGYAGYLLGYRALQGYDQVTGLGTIDAYNLVTEWGEKAAIGLPGMPNGALRLYPGADGTLWGINDMGMAYLYNSQTQSWTQGSTLVFYELAVGSSSSVWGLDWSGHIYRWDTGSQSFIQIPGALTQIFVGADGDAWGLNGSSIFHFDANAQSWTSIPGELSHMAVGFDGTVWGVNASEEIYRFNPGGGAFEYVPGSLTIVSVGADGDVWGLNYNDTTYHFNRLTQGWDEVPGSVVQIEAGSATNVWGVGAGDMVYRYNARTKRWNQSSGNVTTVTASANGAAWGMDEYGQVYQLANPSVATQAWHQVPGTLAQLSAASDGNVWGVNMSGQIYTFNPLLQTWTSIPGSLSKIAVAANGAVWGINQWGSIYRYDYATAGWDWIPGNLSAIAVADSGDVWGINAQYAIYRFDAAAEGWTQIPGSLTQLSLGVDGAVWGLDQESRVYRFDAQSSAFALMPGSLTQISVGSSTNVWGLDAQGYIYRFDTGTQSWQGVPGKLVQIRAAFDGSVWGINSDALIFRFDAASGSWQEVPGALAFLALGADSVVWGVNSAGETYYFQ